MKKLDLVTGAFSHTGRYIARRLLAAGREVRTLTGHPDRPHEFGDRIAAYPYSFEDPARLAEALRGVDTLYNTYWVRFDYGRTTHDAAVDNTRALIRAAVSAGVRKIVHVSIANAVEDSPLRYYRGKALLERSIRESGLRYSILRPTVIFGPEGLLINNIAWMLRRFPVFAVPGSGRYRIQPIFVEDLADLAVRAGGESGDSVLDAVGPEAFAYDDLISMIGNAIGRPRPLLHLPPALVRPLAGALGCLVNDIVLTAEEIEGLTADLLVSHGPPTAKTRLSDWLARNKEQLGRSYQSELQIHFRRGS